MHEIWIVRHGETEWSASGRHTGTTDIPLTEAGREAASAIAPALAGHRFALVLCSPLSRARDTARLAGFADPEIDADLREWDYGELEGLTTTAIRARGAEFADWTIWNGPVPGGETPAQVAARCARVLERVEYAGGDVLCFGHGHSSRVLAAVSLGLDPVEGKRFVLDPARLSVIGDEHDERALRVWNARV